MRSPALFLSSVLVTLALGVPAATALNVPNAGIQPSNLPMASSKPLSQRARQRILRAQWQQNEKNGRSSMSSSSSSSAVGSYTYQTYADGVLGKGQKCFLFFYANWDKRTRVMDQLLKGWSDKQHFTMPIYRVEYDSAAELKKKYGVKYSNSYAYIDEKGTLIRLFENPSDVTIKYYLYQ